MRNCHRCRINPARLTPRPRLIFIQPVRKIITGKNSNRSRGKNPHLMQKRSPERISWSGWWQRYLTPSDVVLSCTRASQRGGEMGSHFHNRSIIMGKRVLVFTMYLQPLCEHWGPVKWKSLSYTFRVRSRQPFRSETHHAPREPICEFI